MPCSPEPPPPPTTPPPCIAPPAGRCCLLHGSLVPATRQLLPLQRASRATQLQARPARRGQVAVHAGGDKVPVRFTVQQEVNYGETVRLVGSHSSLGNWKVNERRGSCLPVCLLFDVCASAFDVLMHAKCIACGASSHCPAGACISRCTAHLPHKRQRASTTVGVLTHVHPAVGGRRCARAPP